VQNLNKTEQSASDLQRLNLLDLAAICHLGIFEESIFEPLQTLWDPIVFTHTNFGENILIGSDDMPPKRNLKKRPLATEFYSGSQVYQGSPSGTFMCVILQNFSR